MAALQLCVQLLTILAVTTACGRVLRRLRQPSVVGEIAGGLLLGPLVLGWLAPHLQAALFPAGSLGLLDLVSRVGLVLFLFLIGADLDLAAVQRSRRAVTAITAGSILLPFALGLAIAPVLWHRFAGRGGYLSFACFIAVAMSITALPVLASLLRARAEHGRPVAPQTAALVLLSASVNDLVGWCLLAAVLTLVHRANGWVPVALQTGGLLLFLAAMVFLVRPLLRWILRSLQPFTGFVVLVGLAFASSSVTEALGLHAFFGAFLAGLCVPRAGAEPVVQLLRRWLNPAVRLTLPVFFALTGLRMQPGLFRGDGLRYLLLIVLTAVTGKVLGAAGAARWSGLPGREAIRIGLLLNTRGLVELLVLNVGYREGVLSAALYTLFVLMALCTTAMTAPLLDALPAEATRIEPELPAKA